MTSHPTHRRPAPRLTTFFALCSVLTFGNQLGCATDEAARVLEVTDVQAYWSVRGRHQGNNYIHPVVRFRIKNNSHEEVDYIQALASFRRESAPDESWGSGFLVSASEEAIPAGQLSQVVTLRSDSNYHSSDEPSLMLESEGWEQVRVEIFLKVGRSTWLSMDEREVTRRLGAPGVDKFIVESASEEPTDDAEESPR